MFSKDIKKNIQSIQAVRQNQYIVAEQSKDDYNVGLYNGLEMALSFLEEREPEFLLCVKKEEPKEGEPVGRTIASGIRRREGKP